MIIKDLNQVNNYANKTKLIEEVVDKIKDNNQGDEGKDLTKFTNQLINKISQNLEKFHYNVIVANLYEMYNFLIKETDKPIKKEILIENYKKILILMNPFIPHFSNECLNTINEDQIEWPKISKEDLIEEYINFVVQINGKKMDVPSYQVKVNDVISLTSKGTKIPLVAEAIKEVSSDASWLEQKGAVAKIARLPERTDITEAIEEQLIVEYYSR